MSSLEDLARTGRWADLESALSTLAGERVVARPAARFAGLADLSVLTGRTRRGLLDTLRRTGAPEPLLKLRGAGNIWDGVEAATFTPSGRWGKHQPGPNTPKPSRAALAKVAGHPEPPKRRPAASPDGATVVPTPRANPNRTVVP